MLAQRSGDSVSAAAGIDEINQGNGMHLHINGLFHPQQPYVPTAHVNCIGRHRNRERESDLFPCWSRLPRQQIVLIPQFCPH